MHSEIVVSITIGDGEVLMKKPSAKQSVKYENHDKPVLCLFIHNA